MAMKRQSTTPTQFSLLYPEAASEVMSSLRVMSYVIIVYCYLKLSTTDNFCIKVMIQMLNQEAAETYPCLNGGKFTPTLKFLIKCFFNCLAIKHWCSFTRPSHWISIWYFLLQPQHFCICFDFLHFLFYFIFTKALDMLFGALYVLAIFFFFFLHLKFYNYMHIFIELHRCLIHGWSVWKYLIQRACL